MTPAARLLERLSAGRVVAPGVSGALRAYLAAELMQAGRVPLVIAADADDAESLHQDLCFMLGVPLERAADRGVLFLGADDKSPYEEYSPDARAVMERIHVLYRLSREPQSVGAVVMSPRTLGRKLVPPTFFSRFGEYVVAGEEIDRQHLVGRLTRAGYNAVSAVEDPGTFSVRGGILDVFSPRLSRPIRIDLFGDEVDSIHLFDPTTHRNLQTLEDAILLPAREIAFDEDVRASATRGIHELVEASVVPSRRVNAVLEDIQNEIHFFGIESLLPLFHPEGLVGAEAYLPQGDQVVLMLGDREALLEEAEAYDTETHLAYERARAQAQLALAPEAHLADVPAVLDQVSGGDQVETPELAVGVEAPLSVRHETLDELRGEILRATRTREEADDDVLSPLTQRLKKWRNDGLATFLVCQSRGQAERLGSMLDGKGVSVRRLDEPFGLEAWHAALEPHEAFRRRTGTLKDKSVHAWIVRGDLTAGFVLPGAGLAFVAEEQVFGARMKKRRRRKPAAGEFVSDLADLAAGDFVVHVDYGVGKYLGLTKLVVDGVAEDYLHLEYKDEEKLYLPVHRLRLIQKYVGAQEGRAPSLDKLGGTTWIKTKQKVKDHLLKMAAELLRLFEKRLAVDPRPLG
ncbi:MAG: CarD family transcriptional regulator, partial [Myxococcota bacterium]